MSRHAVLAALALLASGCAVDLSNNAPAAAPSVTKVETLSVSDRAAIDAAVRNVYAVISGPAGQARDWDRMRSLFVEGARISAIGPKGVRGGTVEDYIAKSGPLLTQHGFTERELARRVEGFGNLAHVWSSYDGRSTDGVLKVRGINSFQLAKGADGQWRVQSILYQPETDDIRLPADMEDK